LGQEGIIGDALNHSCKECTHDYKATADHINADDNAAVVGIDENCTVPILREDAENTEYADMDDNAMETDLVPEPKVKMIVVDGIVMGQTTVPIRIVLKNWQMHEQEYFVKDMKVNMKDYAK
ncbi:hypothetical protein BDQ17DRAFT_1261833, partial [Cyathus striatus]